MSHCRTRPAHGRARRRACRPASAIHEVGARDGLQNEKADRPDRGQGGVHPPAGRGRADHDRGDQLRAPQVGAAARRRRASCSRCSPTLDGRRACRCWCRTTRAWTGRSRSASAEIAVFGSATETFAQGQPQPHGRRVAGDVRAGGGAGQAAGVHGPRLPVDVLRRPLGGRRSRSAQVVARSPRRCSTWAATELSLGDTIGVGTPGQVARPARRARASAGVADRPARPCTSTTPTARRSPTPCAALQHGVTMVDASAGGLGGCPYAKSATGNLATEDLVWMLDGLGIDTGVDLAASSPPASGWPSSWAAPARPAPSAPSPTRSSEHDDRLDHRLPDEHEELRRTVEEFAHDVVAPEDRRLLRAARVPVRDRRGRWAGWACSACRSPRSTAAWAATTSRCASRWRSWPGSTRRWRSPWRPASRWARCRSTGSAPRSRSGSGCRGCAPARCSAPSA